MSQKDEDIEVTENYKKYKELEPQAKIRQRMNR